MVVSASSSSSSDNGGEGQVGPYRGELILATVSPPIEGLILSVQGAGEQKTLQVLMPGYRKKGYQTVPAAVIYLDAVSLPKVTRNKRVKLPGGEELAKEVEAGKVDFYWIAKVLEEQKRKVAEIDGDVIRQSVRKSSSSSSSALIPPESNKMRTRSMTTGEGSFVREKSVDYAYDEEEDEEDSLSDEEEEVGHKKENSKKSMFRCVFDVNDTRGLQFRTARAIGDRTRRKMVRKALTDVYGAFTTMESWVEKMIREATDRGGFRPFQMEMITIRRYAVILDRFMLSSLYGGWAAWNELGVDELIEGILELAVRISPAKDYPDILDEDVRKWMKKKRFGAQSKWGPVAASLKGAQATENGLLVENNQWQWNGRQRWDGGGRGGSRPFQQPFQAQGGRGTNQRWSGNSNQGNSNQGRPPVSTNENASRPT